MALLPVRVELFYRDAGAKPPCRWCSRSGIYTVEQIEEFDISYWISYAQNYAQSIGLTLDETATECWDNPISANANNKNIGADIEIRLNRYKNVDGFTSVWIWAELISDTQYEFYIGYA